MPNSVRKNTTGKSVPPVTVGMSAADIPGLRETATSIGRKLQLDQRWICAGQLSGTSASPSEFTTRNETWFRVRMRGFAEEEMAR